MRITDRLDYQPGRILIQRTVRLVHVAKDDPDATPIKPAAPPSLGLGATARLVAYTTAAKYCHHRPHYRTEGILQRRHGVHIPRNTLCHWDKVVADTLEPLYKLNRYRPPARGSCPRRRVVPEMPEVPGFSCANLAGCRIEANEESPAAIFRRDPIALQRLADLAPAGDGPQKAELL